MQVFHGGDTEHLDSIEVSFGTFLGQIVYDGQALKQSKDSTLKGES